MGPGFEPQAAQRFFCPHRLEVRTPGFHLGNRGSIPLGDAFFVKCLFRISTWLFRSQAGVFISLSSISITYFFSKVAFLHYTPTGSYVFEILFCVLEAIAFLAVGRATHAQQV